MKWYLRKGEMGKREVIGWVGVVYYGMEWESRLIGMNVCERSKVEMYVEEGKIEGMVMRGKWNGVLYGMWEIGGGKEGVENFVWFD